MYMAEEKSLRDFNSRDWKNFGRVFILIGLIIIFLAKEVMIGLGFVAIGFVLLVILKVQKSLRI